MYRSAIVNELGHVMFWCDELQGDEQIECILNGHPEWSVKCVEIQKARCKIMLEDIYKMLGFDDTVFDTPEKTDKAHTKLMELLNMCKQLGIIGKIDEDMLDRIESEDL